MKIESLNIAYSYFGNVNELDPAKISDIYQANLIENLYVRLIEYDNEGNLVCNLCTSYNVEGNKIIFEIKDSFKTSTGYSITAKDIELSFKRLLKKETNTHGQLSVFIENASKIVSNENRLMIELKEANYLHFALTLFTSMDYSIVPSISIDKNDEITDYTNTSGPYYVSNSNDDYIELRANKNSDLFNENMPQNIKIVRTSNSESVEKFKNREVDVIDVTMYPKTNIYKELFDNHETINFNSMKTLPMNLLYMGISPLAQQNFSSEQLYYVSKIIKTEYQKLNIFGYGYTDAYQFFQGSGNGQLSEEQINELKEIRKKEEQFPASQKIQFGVLKASYEKLKKSFEKYNFIELVAYENDPAFIDPKDQPDVYLQTTDSSFYEDINVISYNLNAGNFGLTKKDGLKWMTGYLKLESKKDRIETLSKLHYDILKKPSLCPIVISPYWAIARNDLELNFPTQFPGSHWWKIRKS